MVRTRQHCATCNLQPASQLFLENSLFTRLTITRMSDIFNDGGRGRRQIYRTCSGGILLSSHWLLFSIPHVHAYLREFEPCPDSCGRFKLCRHKKGTPLIASHIRSPRRQNLTRLYQGLMQAAEKHGFTGEGFEYIWSPVWWCGIVMLVSGESMNTAAYAFAPAVLVTSLLHLRYNLRPGPGNHNPNANELSK
ncbi:hypothetical protein BDV10DRAFT_156530 [Aspergillus recurvatus]